MADPEIRPIQNREHNPELNQVGQPIQNLATDPESIHSIPEKGFRGFYETLFSPAMPYFARCFLSPIA